MCRGVLARRQSKCLHRAMRTLDTICIPAEWRAKNQRSQRTTHRVHQATCVAPPIVQCNAGCPGRASLKSLVFTRFKLRRLLCEALRPPLFADPFSNCSWLLQHHETASQSVWSCSAGHKLKRLRRTGFCVVRAMARTTHVKFHWQCQHWKGTQSRIRSMWPHLCHAGYLGTAQRLLCFLPPHCFHCIQCTRLLHDKGADACVAGLHRFVLVVRGIACCVVHKLADDIKPASSVRGFVDYLAARVCLQYCSSPVRLTVQHASKSESSSKHNEMAVRQVFSLLWQSGKAKRRTTPYWQRLSRLSEQVSDPRGAWQAHNPHSPCQDKSQRSDLFNDRSTSQGGAVRRKQCVGCCVHKQSKRADGRPDDYFKATNDGM